jgi:hypothetical protein
MKMLRPGRTVVLMLFLIALASALQGAPRSAARANGSSMKETCHEKVDKEEPEGEGRAHIGQLQVQRFSECMTGRPMCSRADTQVQS